VPIIKARHQANTCQNLKRHTTAFPNEVSLFYNDVMFHSIGKHLSDMFPIKNGLK